MNVKVIFMSIVVLGLIVNTSSFSDLAFADKPNKESTKITAKEAKESTKITAKEAKESTKITAKEAKNEVKEFKGGTLLTTSSTTTICHIPPGNPGNNHTITIGNSAVNAHIGHGDEPISCESVNWEELGSSTNEEIKEFEDVAIITTSSTTTICHIPPGNPGNNHTITIGNSAVNAHIGHGDEPISCESVNWEELGSSTNEQELKSTETDENLIDQFTKQIADLQKRLQKLFGM